jgi:hypothetical protein
LDVNKGTADHFEELCICSRKTTISSFNKSMAMSVFPDRWKVSYVTPIFKKGRCNNAEDYRGVAILSEIPKRFEWLVYRGICNDLKNLMSINQHGFMKNR